MINLCNELRPDLDWILIDSPAGIERGFRNAIAPADSVIVVTNPEVSAVRDADRIIGIIESEEKGPAQLIINRINPAMVKKGDMLTVQDILDLLAVDLLGLIPEDDNVVASTNRGTPIVLDGRSKAGMAFSNIARRLSGEVIPLMMLEGKDSIFNRLSKLLNPGVN
jgi:septum site-determining protein MinD